MDRQEHEDLSEALRELDATPAEIETWTPIVRRLMAWPERRVTPTDQARLLFILDQAMPRHSEVRQAIRERLMRRNRLVALLATAQAQVSVLRFTFWGLSLLIVLVGAIIELSAPNALAALWLRALAPLLAYLSVASAFRGVRLHTLEWELACPPSALQIIIARLVVVLGYDVGLGLLLSLVIWAQGSESFLLVTLYWLVPLLLVAGLALVLSLWFSVLSATALAYSGWLVLLFGSGYVDRLLSPGGELILGFAGIAMLALALWRFARQVPRHFLALTT